MDGGRDDCERGAAPDRPYELPAELLIDTDVARRIIGEFIRGQLDRPASSSASLGLSGGIDSALVAYLVGGGHRRRTTCCA